MIVPPNLTGRICLNPGQKSHQRWFARASGPDEGYLHMGGDVRGEAAEKHLAARLHELDILEPNCSLERLDHRGVGGIDLRLLIEHSAEPIESIRPLRERLRGAGELSRWS